MKKAFFFPAAFLLLALAFHAAAQIPRTLSYQGVLTDNAGKPRPDGSYSFMFRFYTSPTGGTAIWSESKSLSVKNGLFSTVLGEQTPFGAAVKFDKQYWLGIQVGNEPELSPRIALTSVGYSFSSLRADTASVSVASLADTTWRHTGANIYRMNGNVGIGTNDIGARLAIAGSGDQWIDISSTDGLASRTRLLAVASSGVQESGLQYRGRFIFSDEKQNVVSLNNGSNIGVSGPGDQWLEISSTHELASRARLLAVVSGGRQESQLQYRSRFLFHDGDQTVLTMNVGNVGIGTTSPTTKLHVEGTTTTKALAITGGGDLAEPFEISESQPIPKGALVIIDEDNPGRLKLSHQAYDKRVAGVVSGAGGINPGLTLTQEGVLEGGQNVALSGRVYALASASNGPIKPGDLLTTSDVPGHAMKATEASRSHGTIIGKAMSSLEQGEGLVLVLVNLQ